MVIWIVNVFSYIYHDLIDEYMWMLIIHIVI